MSLTTVARRYSKALHGVALDADAVGPITEQLQGLAEGIAKSSELRIIFTNPAFDIEERKKLIGALAEQWKFHPKFRNFLFLLADRKRLGALPAIARMFQERADAHVGLVRGTVSSPVKLDATHKQELQKLLSSNLGKKVELNEEIDESIIGGFRVVVGSLVYDATVDARFARLRETIVKEL